MTVAIRLGRDWERELRVSPYRLRFELNQSGPTYVNMFTSSYDRARRLAREALPSNEVLAILAADPWSRRPVGITRREWASGPAFERLAAIGVPTEAAEAEWLGYVYEEDERDPKTKPWPHRAIRLSWDAADILLWNQVAKEMGVYPHVPVVTKLVDPEPAI